MFFLIAGPMDDALGTNFCIPLGSRVILKKHINVCMKWKIRKIIEVCGYQKIL